MFAFFIPFFGWVGGVFGIIYIAIKKFITPALALSMQITSATFIITVSIVLLKFTIDFIMLSYNMISDVILLTDNIPINDKLSFISYVFHRLGIVELYNFTMSLIINLLFSVVVIKLLTIIRYTSTILSDQFWKIGMLLK